MPETKKPTLHPRNKNKGQYDLKALIKVNPDLAKYIKTNKLGIDTIDFTNPIAVKLLNKSLLNHYYGIQFWKFPDTNLCHLSQVEQITYTTWLIYWGKMTTLLVWILVLVQFVFTL